MLMVDYPGTAEKRECKLPKRVDREPYGKFALLTLLFDLNFDVHFEFDSLYMFMHAQA